MDEMTEGTRLIAAEILWRLAAGAVGGLFVSAAAFKLLSRGNFEEWLARLMDRRVSSEVQFLAALGHESLEALSALGVGMTPFALVLDGAGRVLAKGVLSREEHLEHLELQAKELGEAG